MSLASQYELIIGSRAGSSWSLRPWLVMRQAGLPFTETLIALRRPNTRAELAKYSPSGLVPALKIGTVTLWDSLAIAETLAERHPDKLLWPDDAMDRALARSVAAEMHSGFRDLRYGMPMDFLARGLTAEITPTVASDIRRIVAVWCAMRSRYAAGGPFLFGRFSIADAMYAPVASRFTTYAPNLAAFGDDGTAAEYRDMLMALPAMQDWATAAANEPPLPKLQ